MFSLHKKSNNKHFVAFLACISLGVSFVNSPTMRGKKGNALVLKSLANIHTANVIVNISTTFYGLL